MNVSFIKQMENLEREVLLKSVEVGDDVEDFQFELDEFSLDEEIIAVAPKCVRCNMCVEACPVNAIEPANIFRIAKITDKCVKCEICVQTCPVVAIKLIKNSVVFNNGEEEQYLQYDLENISSPHRIVRMNDISIDYSADNNWEDCASLCPTNAFVLEFKDYFDNIDFDTCIELNEDKLYPFIHKNLCIGCGACVEISNNENSINLDRTIGPLVHKRKLEINQDICVNCYLCEENCPVEAIEVDDEVVLDDSKCIRCVECSKHCPVGALQLVDLN